MYYHQIVCYACSPNHFKGCSNKNRKLQAGEPECTWIKCPSMEEVSAYFTKLHVALSTHTVSYHFRNKNNATPYISYPARTI
jgi:hypothetical protein